MAKTSSHRLVFKKDRCLNLGDAVPCGTRDDAETADLMEAFYREALQSGDAPGALARVQRSSLDDLRRKSGLSDAVRKAGPFILSY